MRHARALLVILKTGEIERELNGNGTGEKRERNGRRRERNGNGSSVERAVRGKFFLTRTVYTVQLMQNLNASR